MTSPRVCIVAALCLLPALVLAQEKRSPPSLVLRGGATMTNNGISLLPAFSLGEPAITYDLSIGRETLRFEPQFRFALSGKPWSFSFWGRHELLRAGRFVLNVGANPSLVFKNVRSDRGERAPEIIVAQRRVATEVAPRYALTKDVSVGMYYMFSRGLGAGVPPQTTHFITVNTSVSNIEVTEHLRLRVHPQFYFLRMADREGYYLTSNSSLHWKGVPVSIESIINWPITTTIAASKPFDWNLGVRYAFGR